MIHDGIDKDPQQAGSKGKVDKAVGGGRAEGGHPGLVEEHACRHDQGQCLSEDAILSLVQATYRDRGLFEAGLRAALAEAGTMPAKLCAERVNELTVQREQLNAHRVDLTARLHAATPAVPDTDLLDDAVTQVRDALQDGDPIAVKHLLRQLIQRIEISTDWQAHPTYLIPKTSIPEPQATRGSGTPVRICEPNVVVTPSNTNRQ